MPNHGNITLKDAAEFEQIVLDTGRNIILVLHEDDPSPEAFRITSGMTSNDWAHCTSIWSKNVDFVRPTVERLTGGGQINWDPLGARVLSINVHDKVAFELSRDQAKDPVKLQGAFWNAIGG